MNYRVDLILAEEQRNATILNPRSLSRMATAVVVLLIGFVVFRSVFAFVSLQREVSRLQNRWDSFGPLSQKATQVREALTRNLETLDELKGWKETHLDWHTQIQPLARLVPPTVQLFTLGMQQTLTTENGPARSFLLTVEGRSAGEQAGENVERLKTSLEADPAYSGLVKRVEVPLFTTDLTPGASKSDRRFRIQSIYAERHFR
jgi:hypothetical protein